MEGGEFPRFSPFYLISWKIFKEFFFSAAFLSPDFFSRTYAGKDRFRQKKKFFSATILPCRQGKRLKSDLPNASREGKKFPIPLQSRDPPPPLFANSANAISRIKKLFKKERKARPVLGLGRESFEFREKN